MTMEIAGHEFWSADGKTIWYDLQTPRGEVFWLAGYNVETGARTWYHLERNEWSIHFNVTRDGKLFCGDGGDPGQVAHAPRRPMDLPVPSRTDPATAAPGDKSFITAGRPACREAGEHGEAPIPAGAERQLHARPEVGRVPLEYVRPDLCVRGGSGEGAVNLHGARETVVKDVKKELGAGLLWILANYSDN